MKTKSLLRLYLATLWRWYLCRAGMILCLFCVCGAVRKMGVYIDYDLLPVISYYGMKIFMI